MLSSSTLLPTYVLAYIGPGSGLMGVVVFLGALAAVVVALIGFLWYPLKRLGGRLTHRSKSKSSKKDSERELYEE